ASSGGRQKLRPPIPEESPSDRGKAASACRTCRRRTRSACAMAYPAALALRLWIQWPAVEIVPAGTRVLRNRYFPKEIFDGQSICHGRDDGNSDFDFSHR